MRNWTESEWTLGGAQMAIWRHIVVAGVEHRLALVGDEEHGGSEHVSGVKAAHAEPTDVARLVQRHSRAARHASVHIVGAVARELCFRI